MMILGEQVAGHYKCHLTLNYINSMAYLSRICQNILPDGHQ
jgi:hypothetical protein